MFTLVIRIDTISSGKIMPNLEFNTIDTPQNRIALSPGGKVFIDAKEFSGTVIIHRVTPGPCDGTLRVYGAYITVEYAADSGSVPHFGDVFRHGFVIK